MSDFLPVNLKEAKARGWDELDIIFISGDAYVDHPSFGVPLLARILESEGFRVGIIPQPDWRNTDDLKVLGRPKLFFCVSAGNLDSMINNYTADKKLRRTDMYSPDNEGGHRPDRATIVYCNKLREAFKDIKIIIGGVEASLRRFTHYDYWADAPRRPILLDAKADLSFYGLAENGLLQLAKEIKKGTIWADLEQPPNSTMRYKDISRLKDLLILPSIEQALQDKQAFADAFALYYQEGRKKAPRYIAEPWQDKYLVTSPPRNPTSAELDKLFFLPFKRAAHPMYKGKNIPAFGFVRFSTISHRGCGGGCTFCAISQHQGKQVISRSEASILKELEEIITKDPEFKGMIYDIGGPTSNMYGLKCLSTEDCTRNSCLYPNICAKLDISTEKQKQLLQKARKIKGVKKILLGSGVRYDLALLDPEYMEMIFTHHVGGQLSVAPEHLCGNVLEIMNKPSFELYEKFEKAFTSFNKKHKKKQYLVPYFISAHPGCTLENMLELALYLKNKNIKLDQVQNFTPSPMTVATTMYYTGMDPFTKKPVHVPKSEERSLQRALLQPHLENNFRQVAKALKKLNKSGLLKQLTS